MKKYTRNTILYSALTVSFVASYWIVRQDAQQLDPLVSDVPLIEINEQASEGFNTPRQPSTVLVSRYDP
ncbi:MULTISPECIES: hypothetical protein [unclassified Oleiphilus]|jgi:hypothetical protein|uniref:hypothetical protein n=2 Tax=Oleiphilus TaxID=141450 RepID=UPI0007C33961|nr:MULTISPECIES: hypothetical protein [unclassified Oleiphilus]KZY50355.1 hypothetical protein A3732_04680 [Oleiphilus sp. HI0050]KZY75184.1 hypothetical protein A3740_15825 [Oleiphilus sp. HI0068]KZY75394.1 hypothetical protein A3741_12190 [Oleiphilus sp. HI0069]KZY89091.1 hypothetical protein A3743_09255 [Oleiphilus sp. HI0072]KZZ43977.1 hypothetical protein A3755_21230 [Oleiphilus sp. HI0085]